MPLWNTVTPFNTIRSWCFDFKRRLAQRIDVKIVWCFPYKKKVGNGYNNKRATRNKQQLGWKGNQYGKRMYVLSRTPTKIQTHTSAHKHIYKMAQNNAKGNIYPSRLSKYNQTTTTTVETENRKRGKGRTENSIANSAKIDSQL